MVKKLVVKKLSTLAVSITILIFLLLILSIIRQSLFDVVENEKHIYFEIVFLLLLAVLAEVVVFYLKQQSVIILLLLGMFISPSFLSVSWDILTSSLPFPLPPTPPNIIRQQEIVTVFAHLGAIILLFKVGLHSKIERIFSWENGVVALSGVVLPFIGGYLIALLMGGSTPYAMFVGAALTATSVGITIAIIREGGMLKQKFAQVIIGAAVIDDVLSLLVLSFVINATMVGGDVVSATVKTFGVSLVFIVGTLAISRPFIRFYDKDSMNVRQFLLAMAFMLFLAYVAEFIGLSAIVGAFLAGVILNQSRHYGALEEKTEGLEMVFMPIFFISLGMMVDVPSLWNFAIPIIVITIVAIVTKLVGCSFAALGARLSPLESLAVGVGMIPRGEVALIVASLGFSHHILTQAEYSVLSAMALLTSFFVPPVLSVVLRMLKQKTETSVGGDRAVSE